jgi:hypothetical protein
MVSTSNLVNWKKLIGIAYDPATPGYVQIEALRLAAMYRGRLDMRAKLEAEAAHKSSKEEIERILRQGIGNGFAEIDANDELSLDDPLPVPQKTPIRRQEEERPFAEERFKFRTDKPDLDTGPAHPFLTAPRQRPSQPNIRNRCHRM